MNTLVRHFQRKLLAGILVILPVVAAVWVFVLLFNWVDGFLAPLIWFGVDKILPGEGSYRTLLQVHCSANPQGGFFSWRQIKSCTGFPGAGVVTTVLLVYVAGLLTTNFAGRRLVHYMDSFFSGLPFLGGVYSAVKQLLASISQANSKTFQRVVLVEFPVAGNWTVGFVTGELTDDDGRDYVSVFVATAPNPTTGFAMVVRKERAIETPMSVEEGFKFLVSAGVVRPQRLTSRPLDEMLAPGTPADPATAPDAPIREIK